MKQRKPREIPKAERISRLLHQRVAYDRSRPQSGARESYLRSLMGLPARQESRPQ